MLGTIVGGVQNWDNHMGGGWWWVMGIGWLVFLAIVVGIVYLLVRNHTQGSGGSRTAHDVLDERFARGEIDENEYRQRRGVLGG